jgi:hypothetical protein
MPRGLPDSWALWAAGRLGRMAKSSGGRISRGALSAGKSGTNFKFVYDRLILYKPVLNAYLNKKGGDLWTVLEMRGQRAKMGAQRQVGVRSGKLRNSIRMRHLGNYTGQYIIIGSKVSYAYLHHEGTKPHLIVPKDAPELVFFSKGRVIRTQLVRHPGTKRNRYLSNQLPLYFGTLGTVYEGPKVPVLKSGGGDISY